jgi:hypothetical protein
MMAVVVNKADPKLFHRSANTPDFPSADWLINPASFATLDGTVAPKYWKVVGADINEMTQPEKDAVDAADAAALTAGNRAGAVAVVDAVDSLGVETRAMIELHNQRLNYCINRIEELQTALDAMKASSGPADNIRAAIPASWLATATRTKAEAITAYKADINAGNQDT